jgi:hypothetical protein
VDALVGTVRRCAVVLAVAVTATAPTIAAAAPTAGTPTGPAAVEPAAVTDRDPELPEPLTPAQRAAELAEPAMVVVEVRWDGLVRDRTSGDVLDPEPVSATVQCTGVGVGGEGYLLTSDSCLRPTGVALDAFGQIVQRRVADGRTTADLADELLADLLRDATIGRPGEEMAPPERSVFVRRAVTDDEPMPATVVAVADPDEGDAALLKITRNSQPILPIADGVGVGDELVIVECPPAEGDEVVGAVTTTPVPGDSGTPGEGGPVRSGFRTGVVTENAPHVLVEATAAGQAPTTMPGGVAITHDAALVGLVDASLAGRDILVDASVIRELLDGAGVDTEPGQVDRDFRAGLDAYFAGRYTESVERFDAVLAIIPSHLQAHQYRQDAQTRRQEQGGAELPSPSLWDRLDRLINGRQSTVVGLGVLAAIVVFLVQRRRQPHSAPATQASSEAPVSPPTLRKPEPPADETLRESESDQASA